MRRSALCLLPALLAAQAPTPAPVPDPAPAQAPAAPPRQLPGAHHEHTPVIPLLVPRDLESIDGLVHGLYHIISGPAGQKRDRAAVKSLFDPACRFTILGHGKDGALRTRAFSLDEFLDLAMPQWEQGWFEHETERHTNQWGAMAAVWTRYEGRKAEDGPVFLRGINSLQLRFDGSRWWITSIQFQNEDEAAKLP